MALKLSLIGACALTLALHGCGFDPGMSPPDSVETTDITIEFGDAPAMVDEESGTVMFPVVLSGLANEQVSVRYAVDMTATAERPDDYELRDGELVFMPGQTEQLIPVKIIDDGLEEPDETIVVALAQPVGAKLGAKSALTVTINSNILPRVSFADAAPSSANEATSPMVEVVLSLAPPAPVSVDLGVAGTSTIADRGVSDGQIITFAANQTSVQVPLGIIQDVLDEDDETIELSLKNPSADVLLGTTNQLRMHTITDDDPLPTVGFAAAMVTTTESQNIDLTVQLSAPSGRMVTVAYAVTGGNATSSDAMVTGAPGTLTFMPGQTTRMISIAVTNDAIDETNETLTVTLSNPGNAMLAATTAATLTITDDDNPPSAAFTQATTSINEAMTTVNLTVQLSAASSFAITVPFSVNATSTADNPEDFTMSSATSLMIPAGMTSATIAVNVKTDTLDEANETVVVDLGTPNNATLGAIASETLTINDDDAAPTVAFTSVGSSPNEGNNNITLTVQLSDISGQDVTVPFTIDAATTAVNPADYTITPSSPVTIPAGATSTTITIAMKEDTLDELDETVIVALGAPTNAMLGTPATYTLTIKDDDSPPDVSWNPAETNSSELEGSHPPGMQTRPVTFTMVLTAASALTVTVPILYTGTATSGSDYNGPPMVSFAPGATSVDVTINIERDAVVEGNETIIMTIDSAGVTNAGTTTPTARQYTIQNDD